MLFSCDLRLTLIPPGTAGLEFGLNAYAGAGMEYTKASINSEGEWDLFGKFYIPVGVMMT